MSGTAGFSALRRGADGNPEDWQTCRISPKEPRNPSSGSGHHEKSPFPHLNKTTGPCKHLPPPAFHGERPFHGKGWQASTTGHGRDSSLSPSPLFPSGLPKPQANARAVSLWSLLPGTRVKELPKTSVASLPALGKGPPQEGAKPSNPFSALAFGAGLKSPGLASCLREFARVAGGEGSAGLRGARLF